MSVLTELSNPIVPIDDIVDPLLEEKGVRLSVLRLDLLHPVISGNKWFKLKYNLARACEEGYSTVLSFGGAWSNHLHALSYAGQVTGLNTIGIVRGALGSPLTPCLEDAQNAGMRLAGISREQYRARDDRRFIEGLHEQFGDFFLIPEGGANAEGIRGCGEISQLIDESRFDLITMACGTGTLLTGLATTSAVPLLGFQVLKGKGYLTGQVQHQLQQHGLSATTDWSINEQFHCGGYARITDELRAFIKTFQSVNSIPLEPVYSGKLLYGLYFQIKRDFFPQNSRILAIHGGGLQGRRGFN